MRGSGVRSGPGRRHLERADGGVGHRFTGSRGDVIRVRQGLREHGDRGAELTAAFQAAGVPNASRWAAEVMEYRPYPANDPSFAKLRGELAKYNPAAGVVDKIVATLTP